MDDGCCRARYPILLIRGTGFRDWERPDCRGLRRQPLRAQAGKGVTDIVYE